MIAKITNYKGDPNDLMKETHSGLVNYIFGKNRATQINKAGFMKLQQELIEDVLWLEFTRYSKDNKTISDVDFCKHLLGSANITTKKKRQMV